jgi:hypothetical protein
VLDVLPNLTPLRAGRRPPHVPAAVRDTLSQRRSRLERRPHGLVRITLKKAYADLTLAVDRDPLSLLLPLGHSGSRLFY